MEIWKHIPGWEDLYEVSSTGYVRSLPRKVKHYTGAVLQRKPSVLKGCVTEFGYVVVSLTRCGRTVRRSVHALVMEAFHGARPAGTLVRHLDGNRGNNDITNLRYGTPQENSDDMREHGTVLRGSTHGRAKLSERDVTQIRTLSPQRTQASLAAQFGVSKQQISNVVCGHQWKHVGAAA